MSKLKIVSISDNHSKFIPNKDMPEGDVLIHGGDHTMIGDPYHIAESLYWLKELKEDGVYKHIILIAGNHDFIFDPNPPRRTNGSFPIHTDPAYAEKMCKDYGLIYLNDSGTQIDGINFWGSPISPWFHAWAFNRNPGNDIKKHWDLIPSDTDVLITHGPPYGIMDEVYREVWNTTEGRPAKFVEHTGCKELLEVVKKIKPKLHVFGHIHEGSGTLKRYDTQFINASILDDNYFLANKPYIYIVEKELTSAG